MRAVSNITEQTHTLGLPESCYCYMDDDLDTLKVVCIQAQKAFWMTDTDKHVVKLKENFFCQPCLKTIKHKAERVSHFPVSLKRSI